MLWFYWRRIRLGVLVTGVALGAVAALMLVAGSIGPAQNNRGRSVMASNSGAKFKRPAGRPAGNSTDVHRGLSLMAAAVAACRTVSYEGTQMVAWWGRDDTTAYLISVWHRSGEPEVADGAGGAAGAPNSIAEPGAAAADHSTAGVLSVSAWMLHLLRANYLIEYIGSGTADGRSAQVVAVRRLDGSLAARYWLDRMTSLPLRREMFDQHGRLVSEGAFIALNFGDVDGQPVPPPIAHAWTAQPTTKDLHSMRQRGWQVPASLADMALVGISQAPNKSGAVLDASYSDGLSVVSVFMQHGQLAGRLPGWSREKVRGFAVYSSEPDQRSLAWSAGGVVYTVISDAPQSTVDQVVTQLPHDRDSGIWARVGRGLKRMGSWFDPFG
jgi:sigma-E factor negative regulatory protein RseB